MITLFGATGYTGQLIARALEQAGLAFRIAGRSPEKLAALSAALNSHPPSCVADVHLQPSLAPLFDDTRLLINCVGPFTDLGEPVVALAAARGVHYLDITNELAYVYRLRQYARLAQQTGAAIVPACGFEVALSDCVAADLAHDLDASLDEISVVYALGSSAISLGTRLSALRTFATSWFTYRGGKLVGQAPGAALRQGSMNGRPYSAITFPSAEVITVPSHCLVQDIYVGLAISRRNARWVSALAPLVSWLLRTPLGWMTAQVVKRMAPPPGEAVRAQDRFAVKIEMKSRERRRAQVWAGRDAYGLTGAIVAYVAGVMTAPGYSKAGMLAPALAIEPGPFLQWLRGQAHVAVSEDEA